MCAQGLNISNRIRRVSLCGLLALFMLPSCLDVIQIEIPEGERNRLAIQGKLVVGSPSYVEVKISKLFDFTVIGKRPVSVESVSLVDEDQNTIDLRARESGNYTLVIPADHPTFKVELEKYYWIHVITRDNRVFESEMEKGTPVPRIDSLNYRIIAAEVLDGRDELRDQKTVQYNLSTPLSVAESEVRPNLRWEATRTFKVLDSPYQIWIEQKTCYVTQDLDVPTLRTLSSSNLSTDYLANHSIYEGLITLHYGEGLYLTAIQESLSENAYTYFRQTTENVNRTGSMLESPPGTIITNIRNVNDTSDRAFGFFYVTEQDTARVYVSPQAVDNPRFYCPPIRGIQERISGECAELICCDCASVENSTTKVPDFWTP